METGMVGVVFVGVWLALVFLYCCFKSCGGRLVDILSCDCFSGACFDCWGAGGTIDRFDREYPFRNDHGLYTDPPAYATPQLPPIILVNSANSPRRRDRYSDAAEYTSSDDDDDADDHPSASGPVRVAQSSDPEGGRRPAGGALLLRSPTTFATPRAHSEPIVV